MKREDKNNLIESLIKQIQSNNHFYLADISFLNAIDTGDLRRKCFEKDIMLIVVKNTLLKRVLEKFEGKFEELYNVLKGPTSIMFADKGNAPAMLIKEFRKKHNKPVLKAAFVEESIYLGDEQLDILSSIKSKEEIIGDIIILLQSPIKNVVSSLQSGSNILAGVIKALSSVRS